MELHCCGLMASSPGMCASSGGRLPEALFIVFRLDSKGAEVCESCRSRQELSHEYLLLTCNTRLRYSREQASQSLPTMSQKLEETQVSPAADALRLLLRRGAKGDRRPQGLPPGPDGGGRGRRGGGGLAQRANRLRCDGIQLCLF